MIPKTVKSFLEKCVELSEVDRNKLKGIDKLTNEEYERLGIIRASIQNELGELEELLKINEIEWIP